MTDPVLRIDGLRTQFVAEAGVVKAVDGITCELHAGQMLGLVGESGCGKSVASLSVMRLLPRTAHVVAGAVEYDGRNLLDLSEREMRAIRGNHIGMVFQEPMTSLNPVLRVGKQVSEAITQHAHVSQSVARLRTLDLFEKVKIPAAAERLNDYPHQLSGGMRQRVMIAMALACNPKVLIADEPTTALDVTIQAQILALLAELCRTEELAVLLVTHDLGVVAEVVDNVAVMYAGKIVEHAPTNTLFAQPSHPYTQGLLASVPTGQNVAQRLTAIPGTVPSARDLPVGCTFAPRCPFRFTPCETSFPPSLPITEGHEATCYLYGGWPGAQKKRPS